MLFEDCANLWSLSRPMLSLILVSESIFNELKAQLVATQPADRRDRLAALFDRLMTDVTRSLDAKNRDKARGGGGWGGGGAMVQRWLALPRARLTPPSPRSCSLSTQFTQNLGTFRTELHARPATAAAAAATLATS